MSILLVSVLFVAGIVVLIVGTVLLTSKMTDMMIGEKHRAIVAVIDTGQPPDKWRKKYDRKIARLRQQPGREEEAAELERVAKAEYMKKLDGAINYIKQTRLVRSEEARASLLVDLNAVREKWQRGEGI